MRIMRIMPFKTLIQETWFGLVYLRLKKQCDFSSNV